MRFALFLGCKIPYYLKQYESSSRAVLNTIGIEIKDIEFNCCGYPVRSHNFEAFILCAARNLAIAEQHHLNIMTLCKCCFGSLKHAEHFLRKDNALKKKTNAMLQKEGLKWKGTVEIRHLLSVLFHDVGIGSLEKRIKYHHSDLKVATSYGCHALRPSEILNFDNPMAPTLFEKLVSVCGARSVEWDKRLDCCGNPLWNKNNRLSLDLMQKKLASAKQAGADCLCSACTHCQIQFDTIQKTELPSNQNEMPSILYPQLLGLSLGLPEKDLGLELNKIKTDKIYPR